MPSVHDTMKQSKKLVEKFKLIKFDQNLGDDLDKLEAALKKKDKASIKKYAISALVKTDYYIKAADAKLTTFPKAVGGAGYPHDSAPGALTSYRSCMSLVVRKWINDSMKQM